MRPDTTRRLAGPAALAALVLTVAACGGDPGAGSDPDEAVPLTPAQVVLGSYDSLRGESYTMETTMTLDGITFVESTNVVDGQAARGSQDMYMSALLEVMGDELAADPALGAMMESMLADMRTETVLLDGVVYLQVSGGLFGAATEQFGADAWFTVDLAEQGDLNEIYSEIGGFDLASQTETLLNELSDVQETADGVYTGTLSGDSELMRSMTGATGASGAAIDAVEVVITLDGDLLQSMEMTLPEIEGVTMHVLSEIVEVGADYDITAPDTENVYPFEELISATR